VRLLRRRRHWRAGIRGRFVRHGWGSGRGFLEVVPFVRFLGAPTWRKRSLARRAHLVLDL
jgi:hypothetical protein